MCRIVLLTVEVHSTRRLASDLTWLRSSTRGVTHVTSITPSTSSMVYKDSQLKINLEITTYALDKTQRQRPHQQVLDLVVRKTYLLGDLGQWDHALACLSLEEHLNLGKHKQVRTQSKKGGGCRTKPMRESFFCKRSRLAARSFWASTCGSNWSYLLTSPELNAKSNSYSHSAGVSTSDLRIGCASYCGNFK